MSKTQRITHVPRPQQGELDAVLDGYAQQGIDGVAALGGALAAELASRARTGDPVAQCAQDALLLDGCEKYAMGWDRGREQTRVTVTHNGVVMGVTSLPSRVGARRRSATGKRERHFQRCLWFELTWPEFEQHVTDLERQLESLTLNLQVKNHALELRQKYPLTSTVQEAYELEGLDPRQFELVV